MALRRFWKHIWRENKIYKNYLKINYWQNAWSLLQRSISIPISIVQKKKLVQQNAKVFDIIERV